MPEYLAPGVYIEETSFRSKSIEGVSTTTTGFIGPARYGPLDLEPDIVTSLGEFERIYGDRQQMVFDGAGTLPNYLWHAVRGFFEEGGKRLYIARVFKPAKALTPGVGDAQATYVAPPDEIREETRAKTDKNYDDGHARVWLPSEPADNTSDARRDKVLVRARFPGAMMDQARVRFTLRVGQNLLGGSDGAPQVSSALLNGDVVWIGKQATPPPPAAAPAGPLGNVTDPLAMQVRDLKANFPAEAKRLAERTTAAAESKAAALESDALAKASAARAAKAVASARSIEAQVARSQSDQMQRSADEAEGDALIARAAATSINAGGATPEQISGANDLATAAEKSASDAKTAAAAALAAATAAQAAADAAQAAADAAQNAATDAQDAATTARQEATKLAEQINLALDEPVEITQANKEATRLEGLALAAKQTATEKATEASEARARADGLPDGDTDKDTAEADAVQKEADAAVAQSEAEQAQADADEARKEAADLAAQRNPAPAGRSPASSPIGELYRARFIAATQRFEFHPDRPSDDVNPPSDDVKQISDLKPAQDEVRVVTLTVTLFDSEGTTQVWSDLAFDPAHRRSGVADSVTALFAAKPSNLAQARVLPIVLLSGADLDDGLKLLRAMFDSHADIRNNENVELDKLVKQTYEVQATLSGGNDGQRPGSTEYEGQADETANSKTGLKSFEDIEDISIVAAPGCTHGFDNGFGSNAAAINNLLISHAERMRYRIAVLDSGNGQSIAQVRAMRAKLDSKYAALYYPWVRVLDPVTRSEISLPPSGFVAGIYARNDINRAVWKAPANEVVNGALGFEVLLNKAQQDVLNPEGINCFRFFEGRGFRLWGARTISSDPEWKYVNLRRYFIYLERSIDRGTQWAVFEPNGEALWANVRRTIEDFLFNEWQMGALLGDKPEKAYFVRCDRSTMTQNDLDNGRLVCLVGVAPLRPAEFVIFRIGQWTGDRKV